MDKLKKCRLCNIEKPISHFPKNTMCRDGLAHFCKACESIKNKEYNLKNRYKHTISHRESQWKSYGIKNINGSPFKWKDYLNLLALAENKCMFCGLINLNGDALCVDHDHETGIVRFLLCHYCNRGLGFFKDSPYLLQKALNMLLKYKSLSSTVDERLID